MWIKIASLAFAASLTLASVFSADWAKADEVNIGDLKAYLTESFGDAKFQAFILSGQDGAGEEFHVIVTNEGKGVLRVEQLANYAPLGTGWDKKYGRCRHHPEIDRIETPNQISIWCERGFSGKYDVRQEEITLEGGSEIDWTSRLLDCQDFFDYWFLMPQAVRDWCDAIGQSPFINTE